MYSQRHDEYTKRAALRKEQSRERFTPRRPAVKTQAPSGVGPKTVKAMREATGEARCGNCKQVSNDLTYSTRCEQYHCGNCRKLHIAATLSLSPAQLLERWLAYQGKVVVGTYWPDEYRSMMA